MYIFVYTYAFYMYGESKTEAYGLGCRSLWTNEPLITWFLCGEKPIEMTHLHAMVLPPCSRGGKIQKTSSWFVGHSKSCVYYLTLSFANSSSRIFFIYLHLQRLYSTVIASLTQVWSSPAQKCEESQSAGRAASEVAPQPPRATRSQPESKKTSRFFWTRKYCFQKKNRHEMRWDEIWLE